MLLIEIFRGEVPDKKNSRYVPLPDAKKQKKLGKKSRTTDSKENSIIDNIWHQSDADAI